MCTVGGFLPAPPPDKMVCRVGVDGLDVGTYPLQVGGKMMMVEFEGEVVNGHGNGGGVEFWESGHVFYGNFKNAMPVFPYIRKLASGELGFFEGITTEIPFDEANHDHATLMQMALEKSAAARALVSKPWSRATNYFLKYKPKQDVILTVLLVGERLHRRLEHMEIRQSPSPLSLCALPVEIWEMILQLALTD
eukprot:m.308129 g.308129  ORF g.308129 m.308129 type:complete len:193 (-) comp16472_c0_seq7:107-685(-)